MDNMLGWMLIVSHIKHAEQHSYRMAPPPIQLFLTTIVSQPTLRQRQDKQQLPGILIGGEFPGTFADFEEAVEFEELDKFLRLDEEYKAFEDDSPILAAQPVGVPGAYSPNQMHPHHQAPPSPQPSPLKGKGKSEEKAEKELDAGEQLGDPRLQGVNVTEDDLLALMEELGLKGDEANDLVNILTGDSTLQSGGTKESAKSAVDKGRIEESKDRDSGAVAAKNTDVKVKIA
ncbi:hypothetical protein BKA93DRAFT_827618 [Sparassis latifolia]